MTKPCSDDLRKRMVRAVEDGASVREAAEIYDVAPSTVVKVHQRWRATGAVTPAPMGGDQRSHYMEAHEELIMSLIEAQPDMTLKEICAVLIGKGVQASYGSVWRFFDRHGITFKKKSARQRAGSRGCRGGAQKVAKRAGALGSSAPGVHR
jgi:transposase